jgi:hypothetical protein
VYLLDSAAHLQAKEIETVAEIEARQQQPSTGSREEGPGAYTEIAGFRNRRWSGSSIL